MEPEKLAQRVSSIVARSGAVPRLAIVRFEESGPSDIYVRSLVRAAGRTGIDPLIVALPSDATEDVVRDRIRELIVDLVAAWNSGDGRAFGALFTVQEEGWRVDVLYNTGSA